MPPQKTTPTRRPLCAAERRAAQVLMAMLGTDEVAHTRTAVREAGEASMPGYEARAMLGDASDWIEIVLAAALVARYRIRDDRGRLLPRERVEVGPVAPAGLGEALAADRWEVLP